MNRSSNGTYANFLILEDVLEINFHPDVDLNQTILKQVVMEKNVFMLAQEGLPELYDVSNVASIQLQDAKQLQDTDVKIAVYVREQHEEDIHRMEEMLASEKAEKAIFADKDKAREWLSDG
jgi:hypothetical protein